MYSRTSVACTGSHLAWAGCWLALLILTSSPNAHGENAPPRLLPETTPWNVEQLFEPPEIEWLDSAGPVRSLFYQGEPYQGKSTRVFAYYADPGTLGVVDAAKGPYPAVVLVHGGGGTAFREWGEKESLVLMQRVRDLPEPPDAIRVKSRVRTDNRNLFGDALRNDHAVERVLMVNWQ